MLPALRRLWSLRVPALTNRLPAVLLVLLLLPGCAARKPAPPPAPVDPHTATGTLHAAPADYAQLRIGRPPYPLPPWSKFLRDVRIVLDPGHGGDAQQRGFKRGPTGVREAEMNLRVAQYLRDLLVAAGAQVRLTRESDVDLSHAARAAVANDWPADLFISLHHNAIDGKPQVNYTSVWYHAHVDTRPASLDLARYLCQGLYDALALPALTEVPLKSDQLMYPRGFAVLANCRVPCALTESSFYTNPQEEQRLRDPEYNLREAYGLFLALARYAAAGLPRVALREPADGIVRDERRLAFQLDDGLRGRRSWGHERQMILGDSIVVKLDGRRLAHAFSSADYRLLVELPAGLPPGRHRIEVQFQNKSKNAVLNPLFEIEVQPPAPAAAAAH